MKKKEVDILIRMFKKFKFPKEVCLEVMDEYENYSIGAEDAPKKGEEFEIKISEMIPIIDNGTFYIQYKDRGTFFDGYSRCTPAIFKLLYTFESKIGHPLYFETHFSHNIKMESMMSSLEDENAEVFYTMMIIIGTTTESMEPYGFYINMSDLVNNYYDDSLSKNKLIKT